MQNSLNKSIYFGIVFTVLSGVVIAFLSSLPEGVEKTDELTSFDSFLDETETGESQKKQLGDVPTQSKTERLKRAKQKEKKSPQQTSRIPRLAQRPDTDVNEEKSKDPPGTVLTTKEPIAKENTLEEIQRELEIARQNQSQTAGKNEVTDLPKIEYSNLNKLDSFTNKTNPRASKSDSNAPRVPRFTDPAQNKKEVVAAEEKKANKPRIQPFIPAETIANENSKEPTVAVAEPPESANPNPEKTVDLPPSASIEAPVPNEKHPELAQQEKPTKVEGDEVVDLPANENQGNNDRSKNIGEEILAQNKPTNIPEDELFWWKEEVLQSMTGHEQSETVDLNGLLVRALQNSPRILSMSQEPRIEELEIMKADANFDPALFLNTQYDNRTDPVGNTLTTGSANFLRDQNWTGETGFTRKVRSGATVDFSQRFGHQNSNSQFFQPQDQGTATLSLGFSQPLLKGGGKMVSESPILLAELFHGTSIERFNTKLQDELLSVAEAYWQLYYYRSHLVQKYENFKRGEEVLKKLEARKDLDSLPYQIARARSAVESRRSQLANGIRDVRNAETRIRQLVSNSNWEATHNIEMIPAEIPAYDHTELEVEQVVHTALERRPEIKQALFRADSAAVQYRLSKNELLPELTMLFNTYVSGLEGDSDIGTAFIEQFTNTTPGFGVGFQSRVPFRNRKAMAEYNQRRLRLTQIRLEVDEAAQQVIADAQISLRRVNSAHRTLTSTMDAMKAARIDLEFNQKRWEAFALIEGDFAEGQNPSTLLDQLLDSQQRLTNEELTFAKAELDFKVAQMNLKKAMGTLLEANLISKIPVNPQPVH